MTSSAAHRAGSEIVHVESPASRPRWSAVHRTDPMAMPTQTPEWLEVMTAGGGWTDASVRLETAAGRELILPLARRTGLGRYAPLSSFGEGWGMGGVLAAGGPAPEDVAAVLQHLASLPAVQTSLRPNPLLGNTWETAAAQALLLSIPKSAHVLELDEDPETVFAQRLGKQARRNVRRAARLGVTVATNRPDGLGHFYEMLLKSFDRWAERSREPRRLARYRGTRRDPQEKFETMSRIFGDAMRLHVAYRDDAPAAAALVLVAGPVAHYTRGVMDVEVAGRTNASDYVQWCAIRDATELGCRTYHMGESGTSTSLADFKEKFGARPVAYAQYRIERLPLTAADAKLRSTVKRVIGFRDV